jgi:signal recognition particle GTPase
LASFSNADSENIIHRANKKEPFTNAEINEAIDSFKSLASLADVSIDYSLLREFISTEAHINFKDSFQRTKAAAEKFREIIGGPDASSFRTMFSRIMEDGNWERAATYASSTAYKPWAVLVTGLNGIRKTTSINSSWFQKLLHESLVTQGSMEKDFSID